MVAALELLQPAWAWALPAALGPLLPHLLSRRTATVTVFPTTRFIAQAAAHAAKLHRPRHLLLLLLRVLALACLLAAFARPLWLHGAGAAGGPGVHCVIVLDRSASMTRTARGVSLFDDARRRAGLLLESLNPGVDVASIVTLDAAPAALLPEPTANFAALRQRLDVLEPTAERGDAAAALAAARALSAVDPNQPRTTRVYVITDGQATQWTPAAPALAALRGVAQVVVQWVEGPGDNVAIFGPVERPAVPVVGQPAAVAVQVGNFDDRPRTLRVRATFAGTVTSAAATLEPFTVTTVALPVTPPTPGTHEVTLALEPADDALPLDDATGLFFEAAAARRVALITNDAVDDPTSAAHYVAVALAPEGDTAAGVALTVRRPGEALPTDAEVIVVAVGAAGRLPAEQVVELGRRVESGMGLLWFVDSPAAVASLREVAAWSPLAPLETLAWEERAEALIAAGRFESAELRVFEGAARATLLASRFDRVMRGTLAGDVLLTLDDATPLLATRWVGGGRVAVFAADVAPGASDLVKGPAWVPLLHELVRSLAPTPRATPNVTVGAIWNGQAVTRPGRLEGVYAQIDPSESDLRVTELSAGGDAGEVSTAAAGVRPVVTELWPWLALAGAVLLAAEGLVAAGAGGLLGGRGDA